MNRTYWLPVRPCKEESIVCSNSAPFWPKRSAAAEKCLASVGRILMVFGNSIHPIYDSNIYLHLKSKNLSQRTKSL